MPINLKPRRIRRQRTYLPEEVRDVLADGHMKWRRARNERSVAAATNHKQPWTEDEDKAVLRTDVAIRNIAAAIGRSMRACENRRYKLRKEQ